MGINQIWTPPLVGSDWLIHSLTARSVSLLDLDLDYTDSNEVSEFISSGPRLHYALQTDGNSINACDIVAYIQTIYSQRIRQFTTSISTQHVERAGIQTYPADWCCLTVIINMIPPANMIQEDTMGKENEREHREPKSPTSISQQESKVWNTHLITTSVTANRQRCMCSAQFTSPFTLLLSLQRPSVFDAMCVKLCILNNIHSLVCCKWKYICHLSSC